MFFIQCTYGISTNYYRTTNERCYNLNVEEELQIKPTLSYKLGETFYSKRGLPKKRSHHLWLLMSPIILCKKEASLGYSKEERMKNKLIKGLKKILLPQKEILEKYKNDHRFHTEFWICIDEDKNAKVKDPDNMISLNTRSAEIKFITKISNKIHFSFFPYQDFKKLVNDSDLGSMIKTFLEEKNYKIANR